MTDLRSHEAWLITGSQHLYGEEVLTQVADHSARIVAALSEAEAIPTRIAFKGVVKSSEEIYALMQAANNDEKCVGLVIWMHTFSPAKMWIRGLKALQKPLLHLHTQFNRDIPWPTLDMDFMNLNQSAHGDREMGYILTRMGIRRKVVAGHWEDPEVHRQLGVWLRAACGWHDWQGARFCRFGDNMRSVAVTEGDKVDAEIRFGYAVNGYGIGDLADVIRGVDARDVASLIDDYESRYVLAEALTVGGAKRAALEEAARIEAGLRQWLTAGGFKGFTDTFEDLHGLPQLPGIAVQRLMAEGYGFGAEGDWKTAALVRAMKVMAAGMKGGSSFMEDYTYHFDPASPMVLGAHMLEVCPTIAGGTIRCEVHPLGIGGKSDPVRLVFNGVAGPAVNVAMMDMGDGFRMLLNEVEAIAPPHDLPKLPVARVLWKPLPDMATACAAWLQAGGAHHTCFSQALTTEHLRDFARIAGIELQVVSTSGL